METVPLGPAWPPIIAGTSAAIRVKPDGVASWLCMILSASSASMPGIWNSPKVEKVGSPPKTEA